MLHIIFAHCNLVWYCVFCTALCLLYIYGDVTFCVHHFWNFLRDQSSTTTTTKILSVHMTFTSLCRLSWINLLCRRMVPTMYKIHEGNTVAQWETLLPHTGFQWKGVPKPVPLLVSYHGLASGMPFRRSNTPSFLK